MDGGETGRDEKTEVKQTGGARRERKDRERSRKKRRTGKERGRKRRHEAQNAPSRKVQQTATVYVSLSIYLQFTIAD